MHKFCLKLKDPAGSHLCVLSELMDVGNLDFKVAQSLQACVYIYVL